MNSLDEKETAIYDKLINKPSNDWEIYYWAIGRYTVYYPLNSGSEFIRKYITGLQVYYYYQLSSGSKFTIGENFTGLLIYYLLIS